MRIRKAPGTLDRRVAQHVQRGEPLSLACIPATTITRVLLDGASQRTGGLPLLCLRATRITGALALPHTSIGIPLVFENCTFDEPVSIPDGDIRTLKFSSCILPAFEGRALRVTGDLMVTDTRVGRIDLFGARVGGQIWLNNTLVTGPEAEWAFNAPQIEVAGGWYGRGLTVHGGLNLWGADIRTGLELDYATLTASDRPALRAPQLTVTGDLTLGGGASISGAVNLNSATVGGCLRLHYEVTNEHTLSISGSDINTLHLDISPAERVTCNLEGAKVAAFIDTRKSWPATLKLDRLKYETLRPLLPARERLIWLARDKGSDSPQPYEQLAQQYRATGHDHDARTILLAKHRYRTRQLRYPAKLWGQLQNIAVGYGYRPVRALAWLIGLVVIVTISSIAWRPHPLTDTAPEFNVAVYALDVVLPILDLGQEKSYGSAGLGRVIAWIAILAGWLLASTIIASVTRNISRS